MLNMSNLILNTGKWITSTFYILRIRHYSLTYNGGHNVFKNKKIQITQNNNFISVKVKILRYAMPNRSGKNVVMVYIHVSVL